MEKARMLGMEEAVAGGTEGGRSPTGVPPATAAVAATGAPATGNGKLIPDPAVLEKAVRRRFTAEYSSASSTRPIVASRPASSARCCAAKACTRRS